MITGAAYATAADLHEERLNAHPARSNRQFGTTSAMQIGVMELPEVNFVVPGYIAEGLTILAGRPKLGKSWLALGLAAAVASGSAAFGSIRCEPGDVLYLALEDTHRRLKRRLNQMFPYGEIPHRLFIEIEAPRVDQGLVERLAKWIDQAINPRLVVIDVLKKVRPRTNGNDPLYDSDYHAAEPLKQFADRHGIAVVVLHHTRKMDADDPFDTVSGSTGLTGAADTTLILSRDSQGVTLYGRGRDIEEIESAVCFDSVMGSWSILGEASEVRRSVERNLVIKTMDESDEPLSPKDIADLSGHSYEAVRQLLVRMVRSGEIKKDGRGKYSRHNGHKVTND